MNELDLTGRWRAIDSYGSHFMVDFSSRITIIQHVSPNFYRPLFMIGNGDAVTWPPAPIGLTISVYDDSAPRVIVFITPKSRSMLMVQVGGLVLYAWRTFDGHEQAQLFAHSITDDYGNHLRVRPQWN